MASNFAWCATSFAMYVLSNARPWIAQHVAVHCRLIAILEAGRVFSRRDLNPRHHVVHELIDRRVVARHAIGEVLDLLRLRPCAGDLRVAQVRIARGEYHRGDVRFAGQRDLRRVLAGDDLAAGALASAFAGGAAAGLAATGFAAAGFAAAGFAAAGFAAAGFAAADFAAAAELRCRVEVRAPGMSSAIARFRVRWRGVIERDSDELKGTERARTVFIAYEWSIARET